MPEYTKRQIQIIQAATGIIAEQGIQNLTIKNLAEKIGITEPGIYRHFQNKIEILESVLGYFGSENMKFFSEVVAVKLGAVEKIETIFSHHFEVFVRQPAFAAIIFAEEIFQNEQRLAKTVLDIMTQSQKTFITIITDHDTMHELRDDIDKQHLVLIIMGTLRLVVNKWHLNKHDFDLIKEGGRVWSSLRKVITKS
jgi:AcrR family transcriptional regulator